MEQGFLQKEKERKLQYQWYHNFRSYLVGEGGFEPPKALLTDLQSAPFGHSGIPPYIALSMEPVDGLEPPTC